MIKNGTAHRWYGGRMVSKDSTNYTSSRRPAQGQNRQLPTPEDYYSRQFPGISPKKDGWAMVRCPFHDDTNPSLGVNLDTGGYICFSCGAKGGNIVAYHAARYYYGDTKAAWRDLAGGRW